MRRVRIVVVAVLCLAGNLARSDPGRSGLRLEQGSRLWIEGDSNLTSFSVEARRLELSVPASPEVAMMDAQALEGLRATVSVDSLSSGNPVLDQNLRRAIHADRNPTIVMDVDALEEGTGGGVVRASGVMELAGVRRPFHFEVSVVKGSGGLRLLGQFPVLMSDFGVQPPALFGGLIHASDRLKVRLDLRLARAG
jgi:hypothetical protein